MFGVTNVITVLIPLWGMVSAISSNPTSFAYNSDRIMDYQDWFSQHMGVLVLQRSFRLGSSALLRLCTEHDE
jgi:hypothetical protein